MTNIRYADHFEISCGIIKSSGSTVYAFGITRRYRLFLNIFKTYLCRLCHFGHFVFCAWETVGRYTSLNLGV